MKKRILERQDGAVLILFTILLPVLIGFVALGTEAGILYLVRSDLSKAVDAAALAGAKNLSNPFVDPIALAQEVGYGNFPPGRYGTPLSGAGSVAITATIVGNDKVRVVGRVDSPSFFARLFGIDSVDTTSIGTAQKKEVEIMMVLDKSGSMSGQPIRDLKAAALSFLGFFKDTQDRDKMGLITFSSASSVDHAMSTNFVTDMRNRINSMSAMSGKRQFTNAEDAIDKSENGTGGGFTDQAGISGDRRVQQFLIFFTDGNPNAFREVFRYRDVDYDAIAYAGGLWGSCTDDICGSDRSLCDPSTGDTLNPPGPLTSVPALPTGNGRDQRCSSYDGTTRWQVMLEYPVAGYPWEYCGIPESILRPSWFWNIARQKAINHAQELKVKGIKIYTIGLGDDQQINRSFLSQLASGPSFEYYTPNSSELQALFNLVAKEIKLRLVE